MKISVKGRYALAAMINMAQNYSGGKCITLISISEELGMSKIYLEQVFSLLKRGDLVNSLKGASGGYQLARMPEKITAYQILAAVELALFENTKETVAEKSPEIEKVLQAFLFEPLDDTVKGALQKVTLKNLSDEVEKHKNEQGYMFFI
jgi:Rrf2 family protein